MAVMGPPSVPEEERYSEKKMNAIRKKSVIDEIGETNHNEWLKEKGYDPEKFKHSQKLIQMHN